MTHDDTLPAYTKRHWGKSDRQDKNRIHLLEHHLADVGACFQALMRVPTIRKRLAASARLADLDESTSARLSVFAAIHDIGKSNVGFQARIWSLEALQGQRKPGCAGHTHDLVPVLSGEDTKTSKWFFDALGWDDFLTWDDCGGETACAMLVATLSHHGIPLQLEGGQSKNPAVWRDFQALSPKDFVQRIGLLLREWFPAAFQPGAPPLPSAPEFQHMFLGLCNWADWVGSNESWFPYVDTPRDDYFQTLAQPHAKAAIDALKLDLYAQRGSFTEIPEFGSLFGISGSPNAIQQTTRSAPLDEQLIIIESETGSGKTEAALWRFASMYRAELVDGLYFALPTRAAAVQIHERVERFIRSLLPQAHTPPVVLAIPGYDQKPGEEIVDMKDYDQRDDNRDERPWAAESSKRFLAAQIAVGTVDQAMMGALQVKNAHMRTACLARNLLIVDEVHASDTYMTVVLESLLDAHLGAGGYALLMSATLGSNARHRWLHHGGGKTIKPVHSLDDAVRFPYPAVSASAASASVIPAGENDQEKTVRIEAHPHMRDFDDTAQRALEAARAGAKVLIVRNTVDYAVKTQQALERRAIHDDDALLFAVGGKKTLHHGRFAPCDRRLLDAEIGRLLGANRQDGGRVVVGTQTLEQSLDIDADLLITDLCPADVLLQRIGRLHRHRRNDPNRPPECAQPSCTVLVPPDGDLAPLLTSGAQANGLGPNGGVYMDLTILEATRRLIDDHPEWRIPEMNRLLVENATHPARLSAIVEEMGEDWQAHANKTEGSWIADKMHAQGHTIKRDKSFFTDNREVSFVRDDEKIRTRLGDDRIDVTFEPSQSSPFDASHKIDKLAVSVRWLHGADASQPVEPAPVAGGFTFSLGDRQFRYDRLGLRRIEKET